MSEFNATQQFYAGKTIFITGGSGFMGKVLIEKLLYSCSDVKEIIVLMRPKRGKSVTERLYEFFKLPMFMRILDEKPDVLKKIYPVYGEITEVNFGLSAEHLKRVIETTEIAFHLAASLKLEATLKPNIIINMVGTRHMLDITKQMKNLIQFVHLSTAFCNVEPEVAEEKVYDFHHKPSDLLRCAEWMSEDAMAALQKEILGAHPNTYTYTKRLAEIMVREEYEQGLPVCIIRPSLVTPAFREPLPGWVDSLNGPVGIMYAGGKGVLRSMLFDPNGKNAVVPVDVAINCCILVPKKEALKAERAEDTPVYHVSIDKSRMRTCAELFNKLRKIGYDYPYSWAIWYPDGEIATNVVVHHLKVFFFQLVPAYFFDAILFLCGQRPFLVHVQDRIKVGCDVIKFFSTRSWNFKPDNYEALIDSLTPEEHEMFTIDTKNTGDETEYLKNIILGTRQYCVNDPLSNLPTARLVYKIQYVIHLICKYVFWYLIIKAMLRAFGLYDPLVTFIVNFDYDFVTSRNPIQENV